MNASSIEHRSRGRGCAVLIPCLDEELTIGEVVADFQRALPEARIYVFDNGSSDRTASVATAAGATVVASPQRGKGNVVRHMLRTVEAEIYVLADGDATYPATAAPEMIRSLLVSGAQMVVGSRLGSRQPRAFRPLHRAGNRVLSGLIRLLFAAHVTDVLSGYRVLTARAARTLRLRSQGFEIETEMTLQALVRNLAIVETPVDYAPRPAGSVSKLNTVSDALWILRIIGLIFRSYKPMPFFIGLGVACFVGGLVAGWRPVADYVETRYVYHVPLALLAAALEILAALFWGLALVLDAIVRFHLETLEAIDAIPRAPESKEREGVVQRREDG